MNNEIPTNTFCRLRIVRCTYTEINNTLQIITYIPLFVIIHFIVLHASIVFYRRQREKDIPIGGQWWRVGGAVTHDISRVIRKLYEIYYKQKSHRWLESMDRSYLSVRIEQHRRLPWLCSFHSCGDEEGKREKKRERWAAIRLD